MAGEAEVKYLDGDFRVVRPGAFVRCAVTGVPIPLEELKYWSVDLQEAYATPEAVLQRHAPGTLEGLSVRHGCATPSTSCRKRHRASSTVSVDRQRACARRKRRERRIALQAREILLGRHQDRACSRSASSSSASRLADAVAMMIGKAAL